MLRRWYCSGLQWRISCLCRWVYGEQQSTVSGGHNRRPTRIQSNFKGPSLLSCTFPRPRRETKTPMEQEAGLHEPYDGYACNELRRECYRRKLKIVKRGPRANATKTGFICLLRESDTVESPRNAVGTASTDKPTSECKTAHVIEDERTIMEKSSAVSVSPSEVAKPTVLLGKRPLSVSLTETASKPARSKRQAHIVQPTAQTELVDNVEVSVDTSISPTISCVATPSPASVSLLRDFDVWTSQSLIPSSWERLHARLEVINGQLRILRHRPDLTEDEGEDVKFYMRLKKHLQERLLASLTEM